MDLPYRGRSQRLFIKGNEYGLKLCSYLPFDYLLDQREFYWLGVILQAGERLLILFGYEISSC